MRKFFWKSVKNWYFLVFFGKSKALLVQNSSKKGAFWYVFDTPLRIWSTG